MNTGALGQYHNGMLEVLGNCCGVKEYLPQNSFCVVICDKSWAERGTGYSNHSMKSLQDSNVKGERIE